MCPKEWNRAVFRKMTGMGDHHIKQLAQKDKYQRFAFIYRTYIIHRLECINEITCVPETQKTKITWSS